MSKPRWIEITPRFQRNDFAGFNQTAGGMFDDAGRKYKFIYEEDYNKLQQELIDKQLLLDGLNEILKSRNQQINIQNITIDGYEETIKFYANEKNYYIDKYGNETNSVDFSVDVITSDMGRKARSTLKYYKK